MLVQESARAGAVALDWCRNVAHPDIIQFRVDKTGVIHVPVGKVSFAADKLLENATTLLQAVVKAKPSAAKGKYVRSVTICSTMGPGVALDTTPYNAKLTEK